jgi:hypothetical protein
MFSKVCYEDLSKLSEGIVKASENIKDSKHVNYHSYSLTLPRTVGLSTILTSSFAFSAMIVFGLNKQMTTKRERCEITDIKAYLTFNIALLGSTSILIYYSAKELFRLND